MNYNTDIRLWDTFREQHGIDTQVFIWEDGGVYHHLDPKDRAGQFNDQKHALDVFRKAGYSILPPPEGSRLKIYMAVA